MSENLARTVSELLNEEKWTRATLNSYTISNFEELDELLSKTNNETLQTEIQAACEEHLGHTKNSIIALFLSGVISLKKQLIDDSNLIVLINIFLDNHKWNIVEYLCNRILTYGENKYALKTLADTFENKNEQEEKFKVWERYIKVDYEEAEIVKLLAEKKEQDGDLGNAIEYYKKALHRFINKKMFSNVKDIWEKLIDFVPEDIDFFFSIERKIIKVLSPERAAMLLNYLYPHFEKENDWNTAIEILKRILQHEPRNAEARKEIMKCFQGKYADHSQLEEYLRISNLNQSWRNVHDAISDFEKHISFDKGNFVRHRSWGIGKITNIEDDIFIIDFINKPSHKMSLKMAVNALEILQPDHIWVLKAIKNKLELKKQVKEDLAWALKTIIRSFGNVADMKKIKAEVVPEILSPGEWSKWSVEARKILKTDPRFGNLPDKIDKFVVRDKPISFEEKTFNKFKAEKNFFDRVQTIQDFLSHAEPDSEYFSEMFAFFTGFARAYSAVTEQVISSFLLVQKLIAVHPYLNPQIEHSFQDFFDQIEDLEDLFGKIANNDLKKDFLQQVKKNIPDWPKVFSRLFYHYPNKYIVDELAGNEHWTILQYLYDQILSHSREYRESFIWFTRNILEESWIDRLDISLEKIYITLIHLLEITYREISNKREVSFNRKLNKQIQDYLFKEQRLAEFILKSGEDSITRLFTLVEDVKELDPSLKIHLKHKIREHYPDYQFMGEIEKESVHRGLLVTRAGYERKQKDLRHVLEVEIPDNSKEIGTAMDKGDLRENAEYKAALERQELLKTSASKLREDLNNAQIIDESQFEFDKISFGTMVKLLNTKSSEIEEFTILGPWESEPSRKIISYLSPLGSELYHHEVGDHLVFSINDQNFEYTVDEIKKVDFSSQK